jgi:hypothetical protein
MQWKIPEAPKSQEHQSGEKERRERHDEIDHLALGNQMHEVTGHQRGFADGDDQGYGNIDLTVPKRNVRGTNSNQSAEQQRVKNIEIPPDMLAEVVCRMVTHSQLQ